jgi:hypothetical protein
VWLLICRETCLCLFAALIRAGEVLLFFRGHFSSSSVPSYAITHDCGLLAGQGLAATPVSDSADMATFEQARPDSARARKGRRPIIRALSSKFDNRIHRRHPFSASSSLVQSGSDSHVQACCIDRLVDHARDSLHNRHDDGEPLAAERAFEAHQVERRALDEEGQLN